MKTLEQFSEEEAQRLGFDTGAPEVREKITKVVAAARQAAPGADDQSLIEQAGDGIREVLADDAPQAPVAAPPVAPAAPTAPAIGSVQDVMDQRKRVEEQFSPQAEQQARDAGKWSRIGAEAGRLLSTSARIAASPQAQGQLDAMYQDQVKAADEPLVSWQNKKKAALADIEERMKLGELGRREVEGQLKKLGYEQALAERASAEAIAKAENDPASATSEGMRALARELAPDFVKQLGDRFNMLNARQLKSSLPTLQKMFDKRLETQKAELEAEQKRLDRESRERVAATSADARVRAATISANARGRGAGGGGGTAAPAPTGQGISIIRRDRQGNESLDPQAEKAFTASDGNAKLSNDGLAITGRMRSIIQSGDASESDLGNLVSRGQRMVGMNTARRRADEALAGSVDSLIGILAKFDPRAKGAPSNADIQGIKDTINNPNSTQAEKLAALTRLEVMLNRQIEEHNTAFDTVDERSRARLSAINVTRVGTPPAGPPLPGAAPTKVPTPDEFNAAWAKLPKGQTMVGPDGKTYTKR